MERSQNKDVRSLGIELGTSRTESCALTNCAILAPIVYTCNIGPSYPDGIMSGSLGVLGLTLTVWASKK